jgi:hypothetical protein
LNRKSGKYAIANTPSCLHLGEFLFDQSMQIVTYCRLIKSETAWNLSGSDGSEWKEATAQRRVWRDLVSDALPFGRLWYGEPDAVDNAIDYAKFYSRSHHAVIRAYDAAGNVIETHEDAGDFKEP